MSDDHYNDSGEHQDYGSSSDSRSQAYAQQSAERDALLAERRARQMGGRGGAKTSRPMFVGIMILGTIAAVFITVGPTEVMKMLGLVDDLEAQKTSQVDLGVERPREERQKLDFLVPALPEEPAPDVDPDAEMNKRFEKLKKELEQIAKANNKPEVSLKDMQDMLRQYNEQMGKKLESVKR